MEVMKMMTPTTMMTQMTRQEGQALAAMQFKGKCRACGKYGHKAENCWSKKKNNNNNGWRKTGSMANVSIVRNKAIALKIVTRESEKKENGSGNGGRQ